MDLFGFGVVDDGTCVGGEEQPPVLQDGAALDVITSPSGFRAERTAAVSGIEAGQAVVAADPDGSVVILEDVVHNLIGRGV